MRSPRWGRRPRAPAGCSSSFRSYTDVSASSRRGRRPVLAGRRFADAEDHVAGLLARLDVADRLDDLLEVVPPVDHGSELAGLHELLDQQEILLAIAADAERRALGPD